MHADDKTTNDAVGSSDRIVSVASSVGASVGATVGSALGKAFDARVFMAGSDSAGEEVIAGLP